MLLACMIQLASRYAIEMNDFTYHLTDVDLQICKFAKSTLMVNSPAIEIVLCRRIILETEDLPYVFKQSTQYIAS